jgi:imidazolonepropionase-like amidohydrolase
MRPTSLLPYALSLLALAPLLAEDAPVPAAPRAGAPQILFVNVGVFDGRSPTLAAGMSVLVEGNKIAKVAKGPLTAPPGATVIDAGGRTLMPGLIDAHTHLMFATVSLVGAVTSDLGFLSVAAVRTAGDMLLRGFTSVRDVGGPILGLKKGIDAKLVPGPRIWPSGAFISQTGGHGDFRLPIEMPTPPGAMSFPERIGAAMIADDEATVRKRVREQLALGASQIKLMAGGGVSSSYDPLDVTQYTVAEIRAAVEAAENWGTYVTVHAYTSRAVRQAVEAGVKCIDHGHLIDEDTARLLAEKGVWWSLQPFIDDGFSAFPEGSANRRKQLEMFAGTEKAYALAKKHGIRTAWGTDILFSAAAALTQGAQLSRMARWYTPAEVLKMATSDNADLLALSGPRAPYEGRLGVVEEGALADLLLVDGDPLANLELIADPARNFVVIMKDGKIYKNTLR